MKLAMEIPFAHLEELSTYTDFEFAIAPEVLKLKTTHPYIQHLRKQAEKGREVWLDNGWFEMKKSVTHANLLKAAKMVSATHVVAPEELNDPVKTLEHIMRFKKDSKTRSYQVVGSWQGFYRDLITLQAICDEVALPRDRQRHRYVFKGGNELPNQDGKVPSRSVHYFGFTNLDELRNRPPKSLDTGMPVKAAMEGINLASRERRPRIRPLDFDVKLKDPVLELAILNIKAIKEAACLNT